MTRIDASLFNPKIQQLAAQDGKSSITQQISNSDDMNSEGAAITGALVGAVTAGTSATAGAVGTAAGVALGGLTGRVEKPQSELFKAQVGNSDIFKAQSNQQGSGYQSPMQNYNNGLAAGNIKPDDASLFYMA